MRIKPTRALWISTIALSMTVGSISFAKPEGTRILRPQVRAEPFKRPLQVQTPDVTWRGPKLSNAMFAPQQVTMFFVRGRLEFGAQPMIPGDERLPTIKGLGRNFSGMIDPHKSCGFTPFGSRKL